MSRIKGNAVTNTNEAIESSVVESDNVVPINSLTAAKANLFAVLSNPDATPAEVKAASDAVSAAVTTNSEPEIKRIKACIAEHDARITLLNSEIKTINGVKAGLFIEIAKLTGKKQSATGGTRGENARCPECGSGRATEQAAVKCGTCKAKRAAKEAA